MYRGRGRTDQDEIHKVTWSSDTAVLPSTAHESMWVFPAGVIRELAGWLRCASWASFICISTMVIAFGVTS